MALRTQSNRRQRRAGSGKPNALRSTIRLPNLERRAAIEPQTIDEGKRTFEIVWSTGARVRRISWDGEAFDEELELSEQAVRMDRMKNGASVLLWHDDGGHEGLAGVVEDAWIVSSTEARARVRLSKRAGMDEVWQDVRDGILRAVSVGYRIYNSRDVTAPGDPVSVLRIVDWEPQEVSLLSVQADAGASVRGREELAWSDVPVEAAPDGATEVRAMAKQTRNTKARGAHHSGGTPHAQVPRAGRSRSSSAAATAERAEDFEGEERADELEGEGGPEETSEARSVEAAQGDVGDEGAEETGDAGSRGNPTEDSEEQEDSLETRGAGADEELEGTELILERRRVSQILRASEAAKAPASLTRRLIATGVSAHKARAQLANLFVEEEAGNPTRQQVRVGRDEQEGFRAGVVDSLLSRANPSAHKVTDRGRKWMGYSLLEMARECLKRSGQPIHGPKMEIARRAFMSTSDFPAILSNVTNRTLRSAYAELPQLWRGTIARVVQMPDFRPRTSVGLSSGPSLEKVEEGAEITYGVLSDSGETYALGTFARIIAITRQAIINDDLDAFVRRPQLMARSARRLEDRLVWGVLTANPIMSDGFALFSTQHGNLGSKVFGPDGLTIMRTAMRSQTSPGEDEEFLDLEPRYIIGPVALETRLRQELVLETVPNVTTAANTFRGTLIPIVHPSFDAVTPNGATSWYASVDVNQADSIEIGFLEGENGPVMEEEIGFEIDGMKFKIREDVVAAPVDWRGLWKSTGTTA